MANNTNNQQYTGVDGGLTVFTAGRDFCLMENSKVHIFTCDCGSTSFWKKKAPTLTMAINTVSGFITLSNEIPLDFIAVSSKCSPRLPKVISDASNIDSGNAKGTIDTAA